MTMPTAKKTNRDTERHYFERFRKAYALPPGEVGYADKPDVLVKGTRTAGIEITNFYLEPGNGEQRQRPRRYEVASEAHSLYRAAGGKGIELTIQFNSAKPITSVSKKTLPKKIAAFAASIDTQPSGPFYADSFPDMPEITSIWLNSEEWPDATWVFAPARFTPMKKCQKQGCKLLSPRRNPRRPTTRRAMLIGC